MRFNGGAQAGHNVVTADGRHHTFSQFGAGTFVRGVRTHLSRHVVVHPTAMLAEARALAASGEADCLERLSVDGDALVVTPFHQAACRAREMARGESRHGSCGVGVGEVVADALEHDGDAVRVRHLADVVELGRRLGRVRERLRASLRDVAAHPAARAELGVLEDGAIEPRWIGAVRPLVGRIGITSDETVGDAIRRGDGVLFEGAQGVLLDEDRGFHPHTTWSRCTFENVDDLLARCGIDEPATRMGVVRVYAHRHGPGPLPTESPALQRELDEPHNPDGPWQGPFRVGWTDLVLAKYARRVCGPLDALALTHLDALSRRDSWPVATEYDPGSVDVVPPADLAARGEQTKRLFAARPKYVNLAARELPEAVSAAFEAPVALTSTGPTARDVGATPCLPRAASASSSPRGSRSA